MLTLSGTKLHFSTAYHPQSDGQTEVRNRGLEQYLRVFTADRPSKWANFLLWAELALNCFYHEGLATSPFHALYGREPPPLVAAPPSASTPPSMADLIRQRGALLVDLRRNLERAQQKMRDVVNRHRRDVRFEVGDKVLLKLQQYRQHSVAKPLSAKLARRFYGPFTITERIGPVAYRLHLPQGARIHDVFHVSLLRKSVDGATTTPMVDLPQEFVGCKPALRPISLLDRRVALQDGKTMEHALIKWSTDNTVASTWEPFGYITKHYPHLLEDKECAIRGGVDTGVQPASDEVLTNDEESEHSEEDKLLEENEEEEGKEANDRPKRESRRPERYTDFVSY